MTISVDATAASPGDSGYRQDVEKVRQRAGKVEVEAKVKVRKHQIFAQP
jgi:hypothetical protein